jgi:hypothetical protein
MDTVKKSKAGKIIKGCLTAFGGIVTVGCMGYVVKEVKKEYDSTVDENNRLREFINSHDFYKKTETKLLQPSGNINGSKTGKFDKNNPVYKCSSKTKTELVKVDEYVNANGFIVEIWEDIPTGFQIYKTTSRKESDEIKEKISYGNN